MDFKQRLVGVFLVILSIICFFPRFSPATGEEPIVTRWVDPLGRPKPLHTPLQVTEPLRMHRISAMPKEEIIPPDMTVGRICIVVHDDIDDAISLNLTQYQADLTDMGFTVTPYVYTSGSAEDLRTYLAGLYQEPASLVGVVLIGNIPYIIYEMMQDWGEGEEYEDFPCDIFYMDLDGTWSDTLEYGEVHAGNGKYDTRGGNLDLEIWACRMKTDNLSSLGSETGILNDYLYKTHRYRTGALVPVQNALVYDDDDWSGMASGDTASLSTIYDIANITTVSDLESTTASDYTTNHMNPAAADYEIMFIRSHGYPGGHGFYRNSGTTFEFVYCSDYRSYDPTAVFYSLYVCSGADFTATDYLAGTIAFNIDESGLLAWSSTKTGGMWSDSTFYTALGDSEVFGEAFRQWFNYVQSVYPSYAPRWWYGMVLIGDGTLRVRKDVYHVPDDFPAIQNALNCAVDDDTIIVRDGTYTGDNNKNLDFGGKAITLQSENGAASCIIDCQGSGTGFFFGNFETSDSVVDGFTITNGDAVAGGGIYCQDASPTITNCIIRDCSAVGQGGGIACVDCSPTITNCIIAGNSSGSESAGGGIDCTSCSLAVITNCTISGNLAKVGGGINCRDSTMTISNCIMWNDSVTVGAPELSVLNNSYLSVSYSDIEGGFSGAFVEAGSTLDWGVGNFDADPLFVNAASGDYHLQPGSPCIDTGDPSSDYSNEPAPNGGRINMGTYGNTSQATKSADDRDWFVAVPTYGGGAADELAVLGVATSSGAVLAQTKDATGGGALASTYYLSAAWDPFGLAVVSNFGGGAADEIATLAEAVSSGAMIVQVKDATGGSALATTYYLSAAWSPVGFEACPSFGGGAADELAVLATADSSGAVMVQVRDATGGSPLASTYYLSAAWTPLALERCPNFGGGAADELAVLATANSSGAVIVQVKDATGGAALANTYYLSAAWTPVALVDVSNFAGSAADELGVLATADSSGAIIVQVKDVSGGSALASTYYLSAAWNPVDMAAVPNFAGGGSDELAVLATANSSGAIIVQVKDASGGSALANTYYLSAAWDARAIEVVPDMNANGSPELAVLAVANGSGAIIVQVKDASTGATLANTYYLSAAWDTQP